MPGRSRPSPSLSAVAALAALVLLSGCAGGAKPANAPTDPAIAPEAELDADHGALKGYLTNSEIEPLAGVELLLRPGERQSRTALDGSFTFSMLEPGAYTLLVGHLGYQARQETLQILPAEVTQLDLELQRVAIAYPRASVMGPFQGYFQCRWQSVGSGPCGYTGLGGLSTQAVTDVLWTKDNMSMFFNLDGPDWEEIVFEARWTPSTAATNSDMDLLFSYKDRPATHLFAASNSQESPLWFNYTKGGDAPGSQGGEPNEPDENMTLRAWLRPGTSLNPADPHPVAIAYEMRFEMMVTVFYSKRAPTDYSAWVE